MRTFTDEQTRRHLETLRPDAKAKVTMLLKANWGIFSDSIRIGGTYMCYPASDTLTAVAACAIEPDGTMEVMGDE